MDPAEEGSLKPPASRRPQRLQVPGHQGPSRQGSLRSPGSIRDRLFSGVFGSGRRVRSSENTVPSSNNFDLLR